MSVLARICRLILMLLPPLMVYGHIRAIGSVWNHATKATFNPITNYVSDYAYRSPAWWSIVVCIYGFAFVLGFISWHAANRPRTVVSWVVAAAAAIAMFKMCEVASYPVASPEVTYTRLQEELKKGNLDKAWDEIVRAYLKIKGEPVRKGVTLDEFVKNQQSNRLHLGGIEPATWLILVAMAGSFMIWRGNASSQKRWWKVHGIVVLLLLISFLGNQLKPQWPGLFQRISFAGMYVWMWLIVFAIGREKLGANGPQITRGSRTGMDEPVLTNSPVP